MTATGVVTNGLGKRTTAHLNLTVTMADDYIVKPRPKHSPTKREPSPRKIPFAGKE